MVLTFMFIVKIPSKPHCTHLVSNVHSRRISSHRCDGYAHSQEDEYNEALSIIVTSLLRDVMAMLICDNMSKMRLLMPFKHELQNPRHPKT
jgi:hypothetical protein